MKIMSSKNISTSLFDIFNKKKDKAKFFLNKFKRQRNLSTSTPSLQYNITSKKISPKKEESDKNSKQSSIICNKNQNSLEEISSYGTKKKPKINKEKNIQKNNEILSKEAEKKTSKDEKQKDTNKRTVSKKRSKKNQISKTQKKNIKKNNEKNDEEKEIIVRKYCENSEITDNFIIVPQKLNEQLEKPELYVVNPNQNIEGNYSSYINGVANSLKEFIEFDYDSIFAHKNKDNVKYLYYTSPINIDEMPKKKLLLIDLDETLIHSEFRNKNNYKELDLFTKNSKCKNKTFSYSDENYIYYMDVFFRPHLKNFLFEVSKYFDLAIFTAAMKLYADTIIDFIDPKNKYFKFRLYRDACIPIQERVYIKDLRIIKDYDPMNVILMDNSLYSFMNQPSNGMLVNSFYTNHKDTQLISAKNFLINHILPCNDIRKECEKWYHFTDLFYKDTSKEIKED